MTETTDTKTGVEQNGEEYLCVTCGEFQPGSRFEEGDCTCGDCYDAGRSGVKYDLAEPGQVVKR